MRTFAQEQKPTQQTKSAGSKAQNGAFAAQTQEVRSLLHLQRAIGNQAVQQLLQAHANDREVGSDRQATAHFVHGGSWIPGYPQSRVRIQAQLAVNPPGDIYEQEADRVADRVTHAPSPQLQCVDPCGSEYPTRQTEQVSQEQARVWTKHIGSSDVGQTVAPPIVHEVLASPGQSLYSTVRGFMEPRFGYDFSQVRVHTDAKAAESAQAMGAVAYTVGQEVVFGAGQYAPGTAEGRRLLAHELTHVVQQASAATPTLQRQPAHNDVADLELELQRKLSERALLARMLEESQKSFAASVSERRVYTGSQQQAAKLKAQAQSDLGNIVRASTAELLKKKIDVVRSADGFVLHVRFELSYLGRKDSEGRSKAAIDIPRLEKALRDAWTIDLTEGRYAGNKFRLEPQIEFRPQARKRSDKAFQLIVRHDAKGDSFVPGMPGLSEEINLNPRHLQGDQIVIVAHELYHLFGWIDAYYDPKEAKKNPRGGPNAPWKQHVVARRDAAGRGDLLGLPDPEHLRAWRDKGFISQADFDRQTRAPLKVWQEDAAQILYALGAPPNANKTDAQTDPNSPGFDPQAALRATETSAKQRIAERERATERYAAIADSVQKAERAIQLDEEIAALQKQIAERKAGSAKGAAKP